MTLAEMRATVRRDLRDEDEANYRWTDDEIDRHIAHAVSDFSHASPFEQIATVETVPDSRIIDISDLTSRIIVYAVEHPIDQSPPIYNRFSIFHDTLTLLGAIVPDGSDAYIFYGTLHTLDDESSTIPAKHENTIATGAAAFALLEYAAYTINRVNVGGVAAPGDFRTRGEELLRHFNDNLRRLKSRLRPTTLYTPATPPVFKTTAWGPEE